MKKRIQSLLDLIKNGQYDQEDTHSRYDDLLEDYIKNINVYGQDEYLLICELIDTPKDFWYE